MIRATSPRTRLALAALLAAACAGEVASTGQVGQPAPDYAAATLAGEPVRLADLEGEVVLLNVWATWCPPCREEIPELQTLHEELGDEGLRVVGVSIDNAAAKDVIRAFADERGVTYDVWHDPGERVSSAFRVQGVPATMLIDRDGTVVWRHLGPVTAEDQGLRQALAGVL